MVGKTPTMFLINQKISTNIYKIYKKKSEKEQGKLAVRK